MSSASSAHPVPGLPRRPLLRPGARVVRRDDGHLQVGLAAPSRVVLRDDPASRAVLDAVREGRPPPLDSPEAIGCCLRLMDRGLVVDADALFSALPVSGPRRESVAATFTEEGTDAPWVLGTRAAVRVSVTGPDPWLSAASTLLVDSGVGVRAAQPSAHLAIAVGEPRRSTLDRLVHAGDPHLLVTSVDGRLRVGPFVVPGVTACLRCLDAHLGEDDPRRALVIEQYADTLGAPLAPEPVDPALMTLALALAVRDMVRFVDGRQPATWSTTVDVDPGLSLTRTAWARHPQCGCTWGDALSAPEA